jgi:hypothetical protein
MQKAQKLHYQQEQYWWSYTNKIIYSNRHVVELYSQADGQRNKTGNSVLHNAVHKITQCSLKFITLTWK